MAVYTHVDERSLREFLSGFQLPELIAHHEIKAGVENTNYWLETAGDKFILTLYEKRVDQADLPYFLGLMHHLANKGLIVPSPVPNRDGELIHSLCGRPAAIQTFLNGRSDLPPTPDRARQAGATLAQFHLAVADYSQTRPNNLSVEGWKDLQRQIGDGLEKIENGLTGETAAMIAELAPQWQVALPTGTIHADYFPDNVMFDGDELSGIFDFYFACTDFFAYDLAIAMNAWMPEDSHAPANAVAMLEGYQGIRELSSAETKAMQHLLTGAALRFFLTRAYDYLHQIEGSLVTVKDPRPYLGLARKMRDGQHPLLKEFQ